VRTVEDSLRAMFANQVEGAPVLDDPASRAIHRSRRSRRVRHVSATLASVLAVGLLSGGVVSMRDLWQEPTGAGITSAVLPPPEPSVNEPEPWDGDGLGLDIRLVNRVWTGDGERVLLSGSGLVERVYRTPYGLLYGNEDAIRLRLHDGAVVDIAREPGQWLVSQDGQRLVMVAAGTARVASLDEDGLGPPQRTDVPWGTKPVAFWDDRVVLAGPDDVGFDLWDPTAVDYEPEWTHAVEAVLGQADRDLVVLVGEPAAYCLSLVSPGATTVRPDQDCALPLPEEAEAYGWLAPDGRWVAVAASDEVLLVEVPGELDSEASVAECPRQEDVVPTWLDSSLLLTADGAGAISCEITGRTERLRLPDRLGTRWDYVPVLGVAG
jgi:hypothetical protein